MKAWFDSLDSRERLLVATAAGFVLFATAWFGIWSPLNSGQKATAERVTIWKNSLSELRPLRVQLQTSSSAGAAVASGQNQSLVVIVDATLRQRGLINALQRSQPTPGGDGIRVEFENAAFDDLILWLGDLNRQYGLQVQASSFSVTSNDNQGRVNSTLTLER
jgi:general secretion pathway protein M